MYAMSSLSLCRVCEIFHSHLFDCQQRITLKNNKVTKKSLKHCH